MSADGNGWTRIGTGISILLFTIAMNAEAKGAWYGAMLPGTIGGYRAAGAVRTFGRSDIFEYMNGAGELYLAYDFQEIAVRDFAKPGAPRITAEVYRMGTSKDAYGVYTADRGPGKAPKETAGIGQDRDYASGLLRFWKGSTFARVMADRETPESKSAVLAMGKMISGKITSTGRRPDLISLLPKDGLLPESVRFFHKHTILNYHFYLSDANILNLGPKTDAVLAQYKLDAAKPRLLIVRYPTAKDASAAWASFGKAYTKKAPKTSEWTEQVERGEFTSARLDGRVIRVVFEAKSPQQVRPFPRS